MSFRSFQARLLVFFLGLLLVVQVLVFLVVNAATTQETRAAMMEDLAVLTGGKDRGRLNCQNKKEQQHKKCFS